jgi:hypothetical protein
MRAILALSFPLAERLLTSNVSQVVPYDKYLWLFLDMITEYPPADEHNTQNEKGLLNKLKMHGILEKKLH